MSTNHNRIKVSDLETDDPGKILVTNSEGELEFIATKNIKVDSYNALDYDQEGKALDARQGKVLAIAIALKEDSINKQNSLAHDGLGKKIPTVDAVNEAIGNVSNAIDIINGQIV